MINQIKYILTAILFVGCTTTRIPITTNDYAKTSVSITLENKKSGGSGIILKSTPNKSYILTNRHICQLIQVGGVVTNEQGSFPIYSYRVYTRHDACEITVLADLHQNNKLAEKEPSTYADVTIAGHPQLLPTMITRGHFANHMQIQMAVSYENCTGEEEDVEALMCAFNNGKKPVIQSFEAEPVTATIMAGSSGSGVFNEHGELSGLVFAGNEGLSYGFIVPFQYVKDFVTHMNNYKEQFPNAKSNQDFFSSLFKMEEFCKLNSKNCKNIAFQQIYHND